MLRPDEFTFISTFLKQKIGLALTTDKEYLLESRLLPIARAHGLEDLSGLIAKPKITHAGPLLSEVCEAMTTNESLFFRDGKPFDQLKTMLLPSMREAAGSRRNLRIWSAACSTGQEPYSIAMTLLEEPNAPAGWHYEIVATDIAQKVLDKAQKGVYSQFEAQRGLPIQTLIKYFQPQPDTSWLIKDQVRSMVTFRLLNLLEEYHGMGRFDLIMCRNVLIYFDEPTKNDIVRKMEALLQPGGVLMLGATETYMPVATSQLAAMNEIRGAYRMKDWTAPAAAKMA